MLQSYRASTKMADCENEDRGEHPIPTTTSTTLSHFLPVETFTHSDGEDHSMEVCGGHDNGRHVTPSIFSREAGGLP